MRTITAALFICFGCAPLAAQLPTPTQPRGPTQGPEYTLSEAIARGRTSGVQAALARISAQIVDARRSQRGSDLLPNVRGEVQASRQTVNLREFGFSIPNAPAVTDPFSLFRARLSASQLLYDRATSERLRAARDTALAAGLDAERVGDITAAAAAMAWLRLASAEETLLARTSDSVTAFALFEIARAQVDAGTAARIERTRSETRAAAVRSQIAVARNERDRARLDLARALDLPASANLSVRGDPSLPLDGVPPDADAAVAEARANRKDLAGERQRQQVVERGLTAIRDEFIPSVGLQGLVQTSGTALDALKGTWSIGVGLTWPIFDGFRRDRRADEQRLRLDAARLRVHDLESQIDAEARQAVLDLASAREQVVLANERMRLAEQELSEARERFAAGISGSVETTTAQGELAAARDALIQARVNAGAAQVAAAKALGLLDKVK